MQAFQREETKLQKLSKEWEIGCHRSNNTVVDIAEKSFWAEMVEHDSEMQKPSLFS